MAEVTPNFGLRKPADEDYVNVGTDISHNMDLIDGLMLTAAGHSLLNHAGLPGVGGGGGGGGGSAAGIVTVAAADTADEWKSVADYVCDGTADEVEINEACALVDGRGRGGGAVVMLEGDFYLSAPILTGYYHSLLGSGRESTSLYYDGNGDAAPMQHLDWGPYNDEYAILFRSSGVLSDFHLETNNQSGNGYRGGVAMRGTRGVMERTNMTLASDVGTQPRQNGAVRMEGGYNTVRDCYVDASGAYAIDWSADVDGQRVESCFLWAAVGVGINGTANYCSVANNILRGTPWGNVAASPYNMSGYPQVSNVGVFSIYGVSSNPTIISGNLIWNFDVGVVLERVEQVFVTGNFFFGYRLVGAQIRQQSWYNTVQNNTFRVAGSGTGQKGIEILGGVNTGDNQVANNDLFNSGEFPYSDASTGGGGTRGPVIYSPDGTPFLLKVANDGTLGVVEGVLS